MQNVTGSYPPTLLIHGEQDTDVPYEQSVQMAAALQQHGVEHTLMILQSQGHVFDGAAGAEQDPLVSSVFRQVEDFLARV